MADTLFQRLKARFYALFPHQLDTPEARKRSAFYTEWVDVGFLRHRWTNDGEIAPGVLRSNNPDQKRFEGYKAKGVRTVLNLRNDTDRSPCKMAEEQCNALGLTYVSFPMAPRRPPKKQELLDLVALFPTLEKPVLIHCKSGADRTGLAAAIWRMTMEGHPLSEAREELSLRYLHRRDSETVVLDVVLDAYAPFADQIGFEAWVRDHYDQAEAQEMADAAPRPQGWAAARSIFADLYRYAQYREAVWHQSFEHPILTQEDARRANVFIKWIDHGVLRGIWTNFHQIGPGVFRSNHPTEKRFRKYAAQGIKTIVNLRGASMQPQYQLEKKLCADLGLTLIDIPMNAAVAPPKERVLELLEVFDNAERPMILHCKSGADRTGLAAALFRLHQGASTAKARAELSLRYLHLRNSRKGVLGAVVDQFGLDTRDHPQSLRDWVATRYDPEAITAAFRAARRARKTKR